MSIGNEIFPGIFPISDSFSGILLDAYGVFWAGNACGLLPGSKETMESLISNGKIVGILSNSTQLASKEIEKLTRHGLIPNIHFHFLLTSGEIAREIMLEEKLPFKTPHKKYKLFGDIHPKFNSHEAIFQDSVYKETSEIKEADFIYLTVPHIDGEDQQNPEIFRHDIEKLKIQNLPMVCANPDQFAHEGNPPKAVVRQGSIALMYQEMGGQVFYIGKPHKNAYIRAMNVFEHYHVKDPLSILMIGDTPETDIRGARSFGMSTALVTETGIMADRISHFGLETAVKALPPQDSPDYFIGRLIE